MSPDEYTNQEFFLDVHDGHRIYVQDWGKADATIAILYLHGGPGNGCDNRDKQKFNPSRQRVIFHDQRGSGKSTPVGSILNNTTEHLISDITRIADHLGIDKFILTGGSWGSALSLAYGIAHPDKVMAMVIDGVFMATLSEAQWFESGGWREFFPDIWEKYQQAVPKEYRDNPSVYLFKQLDSGDPEAVKKASYIYSSMELSLLKLDDIYSPKPYAEYEPEGSVIEMHYLSNNCFLPDEYILQNASKLTMPVYIIQGRYDMICRPATAYALSKKLPISKLIWTINGHMKQHEAKTVLGVVLDELTGEA